MARKIFEGLGPGSLIPQRGKLPEEPGVGPEEGFVLSRVDGHTSLEEICQLVPFEEPLTMVILRRLWELGAIEVPGVARRMMPRTQTQPAVGADVGPLITPSTDEKGRSEAAPALPVAAITPALSAEQKLRIDEFYDSLDRRNAFQLLEIGHDCDDKGVKRAYFKLSKEFHPDRFFGRELGEYANKLSKIFQAVKAAFELLSDKNRRSAYEESAGLK
jgi:hypothetical protein